MLLLLLIFGCKNVTNEDLEKNKSIFYKEQEKINPSINEYLNNNYYLLNSLNQSSFTHKIDSLKNIYITHINKYKALLDKKTLSREILGINFTFDRFILEYPQKHQDFTGEKVVLSKKNQTKLNNLLLYFNDTDNLSDNSFKRFVISFVTIESNKKLKSNIYDDFGNQQLNANWDVIESTFTNNKVKSFCKQNYLYAYIDDMGIRNIDAFYSDFIASCETPEYLEKINTIYNSHKKARASHIIETYKKIDGYELQMHLFLPNTEDFKGKRPTIVQFHGGSWSEGKPDWFFSTAKAYAKQGWVVGVVEYRIKGIHGTYPFEAVKDAKSALRWIRENAEKYNINSNKIIVTGNSAGGHLSLATALIDNWNESTDNLKISAKPNVIIVNSGVYDLTTNSNNWITEKMQNRDIVKEISPNHLLKKSDVKMLLIHGDKDRNCPYETVEYFYKEMKSLGNDIKLHTVKDAEHMIWYGKHSTEVSKITDEYIKSLKL